MSATSDPDQGPTLPPPPAAGVPTLPPPAAPASSLAAPHGPVPIPSPDLPHLPPVVRPAPAGGPTPAFDAKAMVAATKRKVENPVYGQLPAGSPEGRAAADALRAKMRRKRHRNRLIGWIFAGILLAIVAGAGYLAYRAYQDDQEQQRQERETAAAGTGATDPAAVTPLGEQVEVLDALDAVNGGASPSAGGLVGAIDEARQAVDDVNARTGAEAGTAGQPPSSQVLAFGFRRFDSADDGAPFTQYGYGYDTAADSYIADITRSDLPGTTMIGIAEQWRMIIRADRSVERAPRSAAGLAPRPDTPLAQLVTEDLVVPPAMKPFLEPAIVANTTGGGADMVAFEIDLVAFAQTSPTEYEAWMALWSAAQVDDPRWVDPAGRQTAPPLSGDDLIGGDRPPLDDPVDMAWVQQAGAVYHVSPAGYVDFVSVVDRAAGFRIEYELFGFEGFPTALPTLVDTTWTADPLART